MIFVTVGTQDKEFKRLLEMVDDLSIKNIITEDVIVQAGYTVYEPKSPKMIIHDFFTQDELNKYIKECKYLITHGGEGSIITGIRANKKIIAVPRYAKYMEHTNDHQLDIVTEFERQGYIVAVYDNDKLEDKIKELENIKQKEFKSNTQNIIKILKDYIDKN